MDKSGNYMLSNYKVAGYVKLAKLWERARQEAIEYHRKYYEEKYSESDMCLAGVYLDITGNKEIYKRPEMVHLIKDCLSGDVNVIDVQSKAYLAANSEEFCFLVYFLFNSPYRIEIISDDDNMRIDTILDVDNQRENLKSMANRYVGLERNEYERWSKKLCKAIDEM